MHTAHIIHSRPRHLSSAMSWPPIARSTHVASTHIRASRRGPQSSPCPPAAISARCQPDVADGRSRPQAGLPERPPHQAPPSAKGHGYTVCKRSRAVTWDRRPALPGRGLRACALAGSRKGAPETLRPAALARPRAQPCGASAAAPPAAAAPRFRRGPRRRPPRASAKPSLAGASVSDDSGPGAGSSAPAPPAPPPAVLW